MGFNLYLDAQSLFSSHPDNFTHLLGNLFLAVYQNLLHSSPKTKVLQKSSATQVFETSRRLHSLAVPRVRQQYVYHIVRFVGGVYSSLDYLIIMTTTFSLGQN